MKKLLLATTLIFTLVTPAYTAHATESSDLIKIRESDGISIYMDTVTGVEYLVCDFSRGYHLSGICPRYKEDGTLFTIKDE